MKRYYLRIIDFDGTDDLYLKQSTETLGVGADTEVDSVLTSYPTAISQQLDIKESTSTISAITIKFTNKDSAISDLLFADFLNVNNFYEKSCELGYYDTVLTTKTVIYTGIFDKITNDIYEKWYGFTLKDGLETLKNTSYAYTTTGAETFNIATALSEEMPNTTDFTRFGRTENAGYSGDYLYNFQDTTSEADPQTTFNDWDDDNKWIMLSYTGHPIDLASYICSELDVACDDGFENSITSGTLVIGTIYKIISYVAGDDFENVANILEGTINTTNCVFRATETTPTTWTNSSELQNGTSFEEIRYDVKNATIDSFYYEWKEPIKKTLDWITEQIFKPLNSYPIIKSDGKIYLTTLKQPSVIDLPTVLDDSNIKKITKNTITKKDVINHIFINSDFNIEKDNYITQVYDIANTDSEGNDSVLAFGYSPKSAETFDIEGLNSNAEIDSLTTLISRIAFSRQLSAYVFNRFSLTTRMISLDVVKDVADGIDIGDVVVLSGTKLIQWKGSAKGTRGLPVLDTAAYAIIGSSYWGSYINVWESNDFLSDDPPSDDIEVLEKIKIEFFEGLLDNYDLNTAFIALHNM